MKSWQPFKRAIFHALLPSASSMGHGIYQRLVIVANPFCGIAPHEGPFLKWAAR
jgi:hypothetical protein